MSTISCPKCGSVFPLAQVAQFEHFTCGACGTMVPVPAAQPVPVMKPIASRPASPAQPARPAAATASPRPASPAPAPRPASPPPQPRQTAPAQPTRPAASAARPAAAAPSRRAAAPPPPPVTLEPMDEDDAAQTPSRRGRRGSGEGAPSKPKSMGLVLAGAGVLVVGVAAFFMFRSEPAAEGTGTDVAMSADPSATPAVAVAVTTDPDKDPAAWKALDAGDRRVRAQMKAAGVDAKQERAAKDAFDFLMARDEKEIALGIAAEVAKARPEVEWPHQALGHQDLREAFDKTVKECEFADSFDIAPIVALRAIKKRDAPKSGPWWGDAEQHKRVQDLIAQVYEEEKTLSTPFGQGVAKWVNYHRSVDVMRDFPALHGTVGPYLVFVSLPVPKDRIGKDVTLSDVAESDLKRGREILASTLELYGRFYDAWHKELGPVFGFTKYGPENTTQETTLLINVFTSEADYNRYNNDGREGGGGSGARAYYSPRVPRFVVTYDGPPASEVAKELGEDTAQVQCHEGTHQLSHFYQWDTLRKMNGGKDIDWTACGRRPMWCEEGWAEFFASYRKNGDDYVFMQPLDDRMCDIWSIGELLRLKKWEDWRLREILEPYHNGQLTQYGYSRARTGDNPGLASNAMANLFYGKAWSLNYYLWFYEEGGKPKFRDRFIELMTYSYANRIMTEPGTGRKFGVPLAPADFRKYFGLTDEAKFKAFDDAWHAWEAKFILDHKTPDWDRRKKILFEKIWNLNPDGTDRKDPPVKK